MKGNIYTEKYAKEPEQKGHRAVSSIAVCERAISIIAKAQDCLARGDKQNWFLELSKVPDEIGCLQAIVDSESLGEWGDGMQELYFALSLQNIEVILADTEDPSVADKFLEAFQKLRDYWRVMLKCSSLASEDEPNPSEVGGLI